jgi:hypothetical protein
MIALRNYGATREGIVAFLDAIRASVPHLHSSPFPLTAAAALSIIRPVPGFHFAVVLQRWERDQHSSQRYPRLPWRVEVLPIQFAGQAIPHLCVAKVTLGNQWQIRWRISCEEFVREMQILPEEQKRLRREFRLVNTYGCPDQVFFHDKFGVLLPSLDGHA